MFQVVLSRRKDFQCNRKKQYPVSDHGMALPDV